MSDGETFQDQFTRGITAIKPPAEMPVAFAVYRNTWLKGLLDALAANYPTVAMILGADAFAAVALAFARAHPARTPVLALYGAEFPEFVQRNDWGRELPYLRDVAVLERLWTECFFAADAPMLDPQDYAALRPAQLLNFRVSLHPATRIARFESPAVTIWQAHRVEGDLEEIEPEWVAEHALVTRRGAAVTVSLVDEVSYALLQHLEREQSLGSAIAAAAEACPGCDLAGALTTIIASGALSSADQKERD